MGVARILATPKPYRYLHHNHQKGNPGRQRLSKATPVSNNPWSYLSSHYSNPRRIYRQRLTETCLQERELVHRVLILREDQARSSRCWEAFQDRVVIQHRDPLEVVLVLLQHSLAKLLREPPRYDVFLPSTTASITEEEKFQPKTPAARPQRRDRERRGPIDRARIHPISSARAPRARDSRSKNAYRAAYCV